MTDKEYPKTSGLSHFVLYFYFGIATSVAFIGFLKCSIVVVDTSMMLLMLMMMLCSLLFIFSFLSIYFFNF